MKKRVTIKDIAIEAGVSTGTVHRAIYGKKGVGEEVQKRIIDLCLKHGYRINTVASALKRGNLRIVAAFPAPEGKNRFFYSSVWQGFRRCMAELHDYNIEIVELPYYPGTEHDQSEVLFSCYKNYQGEIDALITIGRFDSLCTRVIQTYHEHNIPIFLACDDMINCKRIACVQADYTMTGRIVAELLSSQLPKNSTVLICAGNRSTPSHYQTVEGFEDYIAQNAIPLHVLKIYGYENERELSIRLFECSATSFLRNWDSILEKKRANLRSISEPARLRQPPPQKHGSGTRKRAGSKHTGGATNSRPSRAFCPLVG